MLTANREIREKMKSAKIPVWLTAKKMGVHEKTLLAHFRFELNETERRKVEEAISKIIKDRGGV